MTTQHTTGPWNVTGLYVREQDGGLVASINDLWHDQKTPKSEKNANARLIAAAPELLAALEALVNEPLRYNDKTIEINRASQKEAMKIVRDARAAIARATATP